MTVDVASLTQATQQLTAIIQQNPDVLDDPEIATAIAETLRSINLRLDQIEQIPPRSPGPEQTIEQIPENARLLWILSGGMPEVFTRYLAQYPGRETQSLLLEPMLLNQIISQLQQQMPQGQPAQEDGVPKAPLQSSNVYGFIYDPRKAELYVRFNQGSIYKYEAVPRVIAELFGVGAGTARTRGRNRWGSWWPGKNPSMGAALNQLIKNVGYPYQRLR